MYNTLIKTQSRQTMRSLVTFRSHTHTNTHTHTHSHTDKLRARLPVHHASCLFSNFPFEATIYSIVNASQIWDRCCCCCWSNQTQQTVRKQIVELCSVLQCLITIDIFVAIYLSYKHKLNTNYQDSLDLILELKLLTRNFKKNWFFGALLCRGGI